MKSFDCLSESSLPDIDCVIFYNTKLPCQQTRNINFSFVFFFLSKSRSKFKKKKKKGLHYLCPMLDMSNPFQVPFFLVNKPFAIRKEINDHNTNLLWPNLGNIEWYVLAFRILHHHKKEKKKRCCMFFFFLEKVTKIVESFKMN